MFHLITLRSFEKISNEYKKFKYFKLKISHCKLNINL